MIQVRLLNIGKMNLRNKIITLFIFACSLVHAQSEYPKTMISEKDTLIVFTLEQARKITEINEEKKYCLQQNDILEKEIVQKDTIINSLEKKVNDLGTIETKYQKIIKEKNELKDICESEKQSLNKEVRKQKTHKWIAISGGIVLAVIGIIL